MKKKVKEILRENVHQHEYPVNPEEIFVGALAKVKQEKKDKKKYLLGFLLFFGVSVFLKLQLSTLETINNYHSGLTNTYIGESQQNDRSIDKINSPEEIYELQANSSTNRKEEIQTETQAGDTRIKQEVSTNLESLNSQISTKNTIELKPTIKLTEKTPRLSAQDNLISKQSIDTESLIVKSVVPVLAVGKNLREAKKESAFEITSKEEVVIQEKEEELVQSMPEEMQLVSNQEMLLPKEEEDQDYTEIIGKDFLSNVEFLNVYPPVVFDIEERVLDLETAIGQYIVEIKPTMAQSKFALSLVSSYGVFRKDYIANDAKYVDYSESRNAVESELEIFSTKLMLSYSLSNMIQLRTGLKVQQINEEFAWDGSYTVNEFGEQIDVNAESLIGIPFYQTVDRDLLNYTKHQIVSIPVLIGINKQLSAWKVGLHAGPSFNVYSKSEGLSLDEDLIPIAMEENVTTFKLGIEANFELAYSIARKTDLLLDVSFQQLNSQEQFINSSYNSLSFGLGVRKGF